MGEMMSLKEVAVDTITISTKEYRILVEARLRIDIFTDYVKSERYSISQAECARHLGFELEQPQEEL